MSNQKQRFQDELSVDDLQDVELSLSPHILSQIGAAYAFGNYSAPVKGFGVDGVYGKGVPIGNDMWHVVSASRKLGNQREIGIEIICRRNAFGPEETRSIERWWAPVDLIEFLTVKLRCAKVQ